MDPTTPDIDPTLDEPRSPHEILLGLRVNVHRLVRDWRSRSGWATTVEIVALELPNGWPVSRARIVTRSPEGRRGVAFNVRLGDLPDVIAGLAEAYDAIRNLDRRRGAAE